MCANDPSQIVVFSQTESMQDPDEIFSISSSPYFIRDSNGELIHSNHLFDKVLLKGDEHKTWFSSIPLDTRVDLINSELNILSGGNSYLVSNVRLSNQLWSVFIECVFFKGRVFSRWVFIQESSISFQLPSEYSQASKNIDDIFLLKNKLEYRCWMVFNLYAVGFTNSRISSITGFTEDQIKKVIKKIKDEHCINNRDCLVLSTLHTLNYNRLALNVIEILNKAC